MALKYKKENRVETIRRHRVKHLKHTVCPIDSARLINSVFLDNLFSVNDSKANIPGTKHAK